MARTHQATGETLLVPSRVEANGHSEDVATTSNITNYTVSQFMNEWQRRRNVGGRSRKDHISQSWTAAAGRNIVRHVSEPEGTAASFREVHHGSEYSQPMQSIKQKGPDSVSAPPRPPSLF